MKHARLVRDKMIKIIENEGRTPEYYIASDDEYASKLKEKLREEVGEFLEAENKEEMADVFEVITAILAQKEWNIEDIIGIQKKKREERGGFEKKIILEEA